MSTILYSTITTSIWAASDQFGLKQSNASHQYSEKVETSTVFVHFDISKNYFQRVFDHLFIKFFAFLARSLTNGGNIEEFAGAKLGALSSKGHP
ncbi:hypothetical protein L484_027793 [Morus notabilis]|uniref:Uncharacterized protein n=1 Tax=Morus notabilis TaxID=981085 RepID=W9S1V4_9ROSA|nr:hypothetical protein L484_027793 [Morus notabilis]